MSQPIYLTKGGLEELQAELEHSATSTAKNIQQSRERGGTVNNAEYEEARNELAYH